MTSPVLQRLESYYDAVPRLRANVEEIGPFTLFVARSGWPYYARPRLGGHETPTVDDIRQVVARQRLLGVPLAFEWVSETTPALEAVARAAGMQVERCPLLVLDGAPRGSATTARMLGPGESTDLELSRAAVSVAFGVGGTSTGDEGFAARDAARGKGFALVDDEVSARLDAGSLRAAACYAAEDPGRGPVGGGSHTPVDDVTEIAGVGVLPAFRRRGLAASLTYALARDALELGASTVFCSAQTVEVSRIYQSIGFRAVAIALIGHFAEEHVDP